MAHEDVTLSERSLDPELATAFSTAREYGKVIVDLRSHEGGIPASCANAIASAVGYVPCTWRQIDVASARGIVTSCMTHDLAYHEPMVSEAEAAALADRFLSHFDDATVFYTNGDPFDAAARLRSRSWQPITAATFDTGVVAVSSRRVGIFWVEDED